jgi:hypothetical protein
VRIATAMDDNNKPNDFGRDVTEAKRFLGYVCVMLGALSLPHSLTLRVMIMLSYVFHMNVIGFTIKLRLPSIHVRDETVCCDTQHVQRDTQKTESKRTARST